MFLLEQFATGLQLVYTGYKLFNSPQPPTFFLLLAVFRAILLFCAPLLNPLSECLQAGLPQHLQTGFMVCVLHSQDELLEQKLSRARNKPFKLI